MPIMNKNHIGTLIGEYRGRGLWVQVQCTLASEGWNSFFPEVLRSQKLQLEDIQKASGVHHHPADHLKPRVGRHFGQGHRLVSSWCLPRQQTMAQTSVWSGSADLSDHGQSCN